MCRTQGRGLPAWIRFRRNQKPAVATTPARKIPNALRRTPGGTRKITPTAIAAVAPEIVSLLPSAIPIARPARRSAPNGAAAGGASAGGLSPVGGGAAGRAAPRPARVPPPAPPPTAPGGGVGGRPVADRGCRCRLAVPRLSRSSRRRPPDDGLGWV